MRLYIPVVLAILFAGWILYHWLIKKDIKAHKDDAIGGVMFFMVWAALYAWMLA
ncbi:MAG TPA: hypothetical protein VK668_15610 [Mucilaginibacter sp.]|nr:hypothetical protein [Mucilaginibacter sp.]